VEARAGAVSESSIGVEAAGDVVGHLVERRVGGARMKEEAGRRAVRRETFAGHGGAEHAGHGAELDRREDAADPRALDGFADIVDSPR